MDVLIETRKKNLAKQKLSILKQLNDDVSHILFREDGQELRVVTSSSVAESGLVPWGEVVYAELRALGKQTSEAYIYLESTKLPKRHSPQSTNSCEYRVSSKNLDGTTSYREFRSEAETLQFIASGIDCSSRVAVYTSNEEIAAFVTDTISQINESIAINIENLSRNLIGDQLTRNNHDFELVPVNKVANELRTKHATRFIMNALILMMGIGVTYFVFDYFRPVKEEVQREVIDPFKEYRNSHKGIPLNVVMYDILKMQRDLKPASALVFYKFTFEAGVYKAHFTNDTGVSLRTIDSIDKVIDSVDYVINEPLSFRLVKMTDSTIMTKYLATQTMSVRDLYIDLGSLVSAYPNATYTPKRVESNSNSEAAVVHIKMDKLLLNELIEFMKMVNGAPIYATNLTLEKHQEYFTLNTDIKLVGTSK